METTDRVPPATGPRPQRIIRARRSVPDQISEIVQRRELLWNLVRKELKVKYKDSVLGFAWSMLNPALYLVVFYVVFGLFLRSGIPLFAIFLLSGLLVWNMFSTGLGGATGAVVANSALVSKVSFPRAVLPLAAVGASVVHFFLQSLVLIGGLVVLRRGIAWSYLPALPVALVVLVLFTAGLGLLLAAVNVYARDTQHLLELALLAWFWMTPIVYQYRLVADRIGDWFLLNPITPLVVLFQRVLYNTVEATAGGQPLPILPTGDLWWHLRNIGAVGVVSVVVAWVGLWVFGRLEGNFAEEL